MRSLPTLPFPTQRQTTILDRSLPGWQRLPNRLYKGDLALSFANEGLAATLTQIRPLAGAVEWHSTLPMYLAADKRFSLSAKYSGNGSPSYKAELTCEDTRKRVWKFLLEGTGIERTLQVVP